ncbi:unannotated protein [freshwater metagenome]|uniref:Unannotated protein n=1 Tax=freshwater metagenome TaxID=449393 RepID=A0A6J6BWY8_9ZZZZ
MNRGVINQSHIMGLRGQHPAHHVLGCSTGQRNVPQWRNRIVDLAHIWQGSIFGHRRMTAVQGQSTRCVSRCIGMQSRVPKAQRQRGKRNAGHGIRCFVIACIRAQSLDHVWTEDCGQPLIKEQVLPHRDRAATRLLEQGFVIPVGVSLLELCRTPVVLTEKQNLHQR